MSSPTSPIPSDIAPRWHTPRTLDRPTYGPAVGRAAARLGQPLIPWQQYAADVTGEVLPNGRLAYPLVCVIVPRRAGKTQLLLPTVMQRLSIAPRMRAAYTAQRRQDAAKKFREDWVPVIQSSRYRDLVKARVGNGQEGLYLPNGSRLALFAPGPDGVHGEDTDIAGIDEAWAHDLETGMDIEAGVRPAMLTRPKRQLWIISAGGTADSEYLLHYRDLGRAAVDNGTAGICYIEYSADPERDDLNDPALWQLVHPAVGHHVDLDTLVADRASMGDDLFHRAYLSIFTGAADSRDIPAGAWQDCLTTDVTVPDRVEHFTFDVAADLSSASIGTAAIVDGRAAFQLVDHRPGTSWLAGRLRELQERYRAALVAAADGPVASITADLVYAGYQVQTVNTAGLSQATTTLIRAILPDESAPADHVRFAHRGQAPLDAASRVAVIRRNDAGGRSLSPEKSAGPIDPIRCAALAVDRARKAATRPRIAA